MTTTTKYGDQLPYNGYLKDCVMTTVKRRGGQRSAVVLLSFDGVSSNTKQHIGLRYDDLLAVVALRRIELSETCLHNRIHVEFFPITTQQCSEISCNAK